jgi:DNA-binding FrmR family transcriptional regulator
MSSHANGTTTTVASEQTATGEPPDDRGAVEHIHHHQASYGEDKAKILARMRRIEGQVRGVSRMIEEDKYCIDVLTQLSAIIAALRGTGLLVLEDHIRGCVVGADPADREAVLDELTGAIERFTKGVG